MNVIVTGANGFLATSLIEALLNEHHHVIGLGRSKSPISDKNYRNIIADFSSNGWEATLPDEPIECIFHLAQSKKYHDFPGGTRDMISVNISSTGSLLQWAYEHNVKRFVFASTGNVYKQQLQPLKEDSPCEPSSFYGASKLCAEMICAQFSSYLEVDVFRIFGLYGPGQKNMLIPRLIDTIRNGREIFLAGGKGILLTPIYVQDAVNVLLKCISKQPVIGMQVYNLAGDEELSLDDVSSQIAKLLELERLPVVLNEEPKAFLGDNTKLKQAFDTLEMSSFASNLKSLL